MSEHEPRFPDARGPDRLAARVVAARNYPRSPAGVSERARDNRAYVRRLLREKQPEFAATLETVVRELLAGQLTGAGAAPLTGAGCRCS